MSNNENERTPKIYESPDRGQTVYEREFGGSIHRTKIDYERWSKDR